jgi:2-desacetyl-2-hydroxyethyl bacteriochlorophyllide A dehydrogenase
VLAVVKTEPGPGNIELCEVPEPELVPGSVRVRVAAVGICGTDKLAVEGRFSAYRTPVTLGHEVSGTVVEAASDLDPENLKGVPDGLPRVRVGDRVTLETDAFVCGRCPNCRDGNAQWCPARRGMGTTADGGMAEQVVIRAGSLQRLPDSVSLAAGALVEPLAITVRQVLERDDCRPGELAVVTGPGAIGLAAAQVALAAGATVVLSGRARHRDRLDVARSLGVRHTLASDDEQDLARLVEELSGGRGADVVYECSGADAVMVQAPHLIRRGGRLVLAAYFKGEPPVDLLRLVERELSIVGSRGKRSASYETALTLLDEGRVQLEPLITHRLALTDWKQGFDLLGGGHKVIFALDAGAAGEQGQR